MTERSPSGSSLRVASHAVLRVAAWPVEVGADFGSAPLAAAAAALAVDEAARREAGDALADRIYSLVPAVDEPGARRWLVNARRALHAGVAPVGEPPPAVASHGALASDSLLDDLRAEDEARRALDAERASVAARHDEVLLAELAALRRHAGSPRFRIALAVANDAVASKWDRVVEKAEPPVVASKARVRRLEGTVLHYLLRACGRPTPHGTFAGIVPVEPVADEADEADEAGGRRVGPLVVDAAAPAVRVEPDLAPFVEALGTWREALAAWPGHRLRRNPTLHAGEGGAVVWHPWGQAGWVNGVLPTELDAVLAAWPVGAVVARGEVTTVPAAHVDAALGAGLLESTLVLDADAVDVWAALRAVASGLPAEHQQRWLDVVDESAGCCASLADAIATDDLPAVRSGSAALVAIVERLGAATPGAPRVDLRLPWRATWDDEARAGAARSIGRVHRLHEADGAAEAYRRARLAALLGPIDGGGGGSLLAAAARNAPAAAPAAPGRTRTEALAKVGLDDPTEAVWRARLLAPGDPAGEVAVPVDLATAEPEGAGRIGTAVLAVEGDTWWYRWGRPQPGMLQTRFAGLVDDAAGRELHDIEAGVGAAAVVGAIHPNPTVSVHARAAGRTIGRSGCASEGIDGDALGLVVGDGTVALARTAGAAALPVYDSVAAVAGEDPLGRWLGALAMAQGWELLVYGVPILDAELTGAAAPRVTARDGDGAATVLSPARWTFGVDELEPLRALAGVEQFLAWRALAATRGLPDVVLLRWSPIPGSAEYLFPATSPLAVRSLFDHLPEGDGPIVAVEVPGASDRWPIAGSGPDGGEGHHLSELAVTWWRDRRAPSAAADDGGAATPSR